MCRRKYKRKKNLIHNFNSSLKPKIRSVELTSYVTKMAEISGL